MTALIIAGTMWTLMLVLAITARRRTSQRSLVATVLMAVAQTMNIDAVYLAVDALLPIANLTMLLGDVVRVAGVAVLVTAIGASTGVPHSRTRVSTYGGAATAGVAMIVSFIFIDAPLATGSFMITYGDQFAAAVFNAAQMGFIAIFTGISSWHIARTLLVIDDKWFRGSLLCLLLGAYSAVGFGLAAIFMDVAHLIGAIPAMQAGGRVYDLLLTTAVLLLCVGFMLLPIARRLSACRRSAHVGELARDVDAIWRRIVPAETREREGFDHDDPEMLLHRQLIEIEDALLAENARTVLASEEQATVEAAQSWMAALAELGDEQ
ncbi:hypothetical protein SAMN06295909_1391 [Plantibacter sp. VKM Ac-1784]|uniref:Integral membrane protein n=1 Tax=Plantibacter elymi (nom. nud.) TaxID=199708 RepID=A0ABY1RBN8_9MICO|nr:hypothetical protein [Plantibacter sp. VKM Ac-1784]SMQ66983.1 hypothetical protein SAMN06295909_1391 [Plantibacter sp. VKM Ac-1784]